MSVVYIAGMHRSGTSMVARMLNLCGMYLGEPEQLLPPTADNPEGYWENAEFVRINDEVLARQKGAWNKPPKVVHGWERARSLAGLQPRVQRLLGQFADHNCWGWKDPRNSLTLPYWRRFVPGLRTIICLRNPLEVAVSLERRGPAFNMDSLRLWRVYNERLLAAAAKGPYLITHYASYFIDARAELRRVLGFVRLPVSDDVLERACDVAANPLRHTRSTLDDLISARPPEDILELYVDMCSQAGPVYWGQFEESLKKATGRRSLGRLSPDGSLGLLVRLSEKEQALQSLAAQTAVTYNSKAWKAVIFLRRIQSALLPKPKAR